jgi:hypothetical protein
MCRLDRDPLYIHPPKLEHSPMQVSGPAFPSWPGHMPPASCLSASALPGSWGLFPQAILLLDDPHHLAHMSGVPLRWGSSPFSPADHPGGYPQRSLQLVTQPLLALLSCPLEPVTASHLSWSPSYPPAVSPPHPAESSNLTMRSRAITSCAGVRSIPCLGSGGSPSLLPHGIS